MPHPLEAGTIRILKPDGSTAGTGFLVSKRLAVTCAHVIPPTTETVNIQVTGRDEILPADLIPDYYRDPDNGDIAFLRLEMVPENTMPLRVGAAEHSLSGTLFQAFGYPNVGEVEGVHARGETLGLVTENGQRLLQLRSSELNQGHSGAPVWDEKRGVVLGMVVSIYKSDASGKLRDTAFAIPSEALWKVCPEIQQSEIPPYQGLETFTEQTSQFFFGRETLTEKLLNVLRGGNRFLAVFGPSGSGKSSLVCAGLLTALRNDQLLRSRKWAQIIMRPADNPFEQMNAVGLASFDINMYIKSQADAERVILFIDQFEELFTLCPDHTRENFVQELAIALENPKLILVLSMRDDFYSAFNAKAAPLAESEHLKIVNVPGTLKRDELVAMIKRPAELVGLLLEEGLTKLIINDLAHNDSVRSSILPLLEFALTQLWEKRSDGRLTHETYQAIGGVTGSLARWADDAYSELRKKDQELAESLMTSLVHLGDEAQGQPDTRRRRILTEFDSLTQHVIRHFTDRRLIVTSDDAVELVHDALLREWGKLHDWIKNDRDNLRLREGVNEAARIWELGGRDESLLNHRGTRLELVLAVRWNLRHPLNETEQSYLEACLNLIERERATAEFGKLITSTFELDMICSRAVALLVSRFGYYCARIYLIDEAHSKLILKAAKGVDGDEIIEKNRTMLIDSSSSVGVAARSGELVIITDISLDPSYMSIPVSSDAQAEAVIPIQVGQRVLGALLVQSVQINAFSTGIVRLLKDLSDQIAVAIDNARSYELAQQLIRDLREVDLLKSRFLEHVGMEFATPLNSIVVSTNSILSSITDPADKTSRDSLLKIYDYGKYLSGMVNNILDLAQIEAGKMRLTSEEVNLQELISDVVSSMKAMIIGKPVEFKTEIPFNFPTARGDKERVRQILSELISNATKFTDEGSITVEVFPQVGPAGKKEVLINVVDTGPGITHDDQMKLFKAFSQVEHPATGKKGGLGLGLTLCANFVQLQGGRIGVHSEPGKGSTFWFTLPFYHQQPDKQ